MNRNPEGRPERHDTGRRLVDAQLHLLDRQILDSRDQPVCSVDDVELSDPDAPGFIPGSPEDQEIPVRTPPPRIQALLSGPSLATRIFGGRPPASQLHRISWGDVSSVGTVLKLHVSADALEVTWVERWVRDHIIGRIPGGRHDPE